MTVFSGGYVGVNVFFVISGYLIARILAGEIAHNRFSIVGFYERRIRRILPCLFAVIIASCVAAAILMVPPDFRDFSKSVIAAVLFERRAALFRSAASQPRWRPVPGALVRGAILGRPATGASRPAAWHR